MTGIDIVLRNDDASRPWIQGFRTGAVFGALALGVGGRLAMRGISLVESRPTSWSISGTLAVIGVGLVFGVILGVVRSAIAAFFSWLSPALQAALFASVCLAFVLIGLTPLTPSKLALFLPVIVVFVVGFEWSWRRRRETADSKNE